MTNQINNQSIIPSTDVIQLTLTLKTTTAQVVETSVTVNNNSPIQNYVHPDDHTQATFVNVFLLRLIKICRNLERKSVERDLILVSLIEISLDLPCEQIR